MGSSVHSRVSRFRPAWRKGMTITIRSVSTIVLLVCKKLTPLVTMPCLTACRASELSVQVSPAYFQQIPENLSRKGCAPIIGKPRGVTWSAYIFVVFYSGDHYYADPQTPLSRAGPPHLGDLPQADQGGPCVPPCSSRARRRHRPPPPNRP